MDTAIRVGGDQLKEAAAPLAAAICQILAAPGEQETIRKALDTFSATVAIQNVTIEGAMIDARTINIDPVDAQ